MGWEAEKASDAAACLTPEQLEAVDREIEEYEADQAEEREAFIAETAAQLGEDPRHVRDLLEAMESMGEEWDLVQRYEGGEANPEGCC